MLKAREAIQGRGKTVQGLQVRSGLPRGAHRGKRPDETHTKGIQVPSLSVRGRDGFLLLHLPGCPEGILT